MHYKAIPCAPLFQEFLNEAGLLLTAATVHHYYMHGSAANTSSYLDPSHLQEVLVHYPRHLLSQAPAGGAIKLSPCTSVPGVPE